MKLTLADTRTGIARFPSEKGFVARLIGHDAEPVTGDVESIHDIGHPGALDGRLVQKTLVALIEEPAHQAVALAQTYIAEGDVWVVDLDLEKFLTASITTS